MLISHAYILHVCIVRDKHQNIVYLSSYVMHIDMANSPAGKLSTPTPTTPFTKLNISLVMVAVPPPSPPRTSLASLVHDDDCLFLLMKAALFVRKSPRRRGTDASEDEVVARRPSARDAVADRTMRMLDRNFMVGDLCYYGLVDHLEVGSEVQRRK